MRATLFAVLATAGSAAAQSAIGTAYGFGAGATGGGNAAAVTPKDAAEFSKLLGDDTAQTIVLDKVYDFTGKPASGQGCEKQACPASKGGQQFLGDNSCKAADMTPATVKYNDGGDKPIIVGSNKSILGNGKGVIKGTGLQIRAGAKNLIIQGIEVSDINSGVVWGGDGVDLKGGNSLIWIDHNKFSRIGREFIVSHFDGSSVTVSNNEFDGVTKTSESCNGNHYWGIMFIGRKKMVAIDKNHFHDQSGCAPKIGQPGVTSTFHAVNNLFENMKGHAFDAYPGAGCLIEGNVFTAVQTPSTPESDKLATFVTDGGSACNAGLGRACLKNTVDASSGKLGGGTDSKFIAGLKDKDVPEPMDAAKVAAYVQTNAGPQGLGKGGGGGAVTPTASAAPQASLPPKPSATPKQSAAAKPRQSVTAKHGTHGRRDVRNWSAALKRRA